MTRISHDLMLGVSNGGFDPESLIKAKGVIKEIGVEIIKVPVLWSYVMQEKGKINYEKLREYEELFYELGAMSIKSVAVLNDQDSPDWFKRIGGWRKRENICFFEEYCSEILKKLGNNVPYWVTHNDPMKETINIEKWTREVPDSSEIFQALNTAHNLNLAHGSVINIFRQLSCKNNIGISLTINPLKAKSMSITDILTVSYIDSIINKLYLEAVFNGRYPKEMLKFFEKYIGLPSFIRDKDMSDIRRPIDFIGINYYRRSIVKYSNAAPLKFEFVKGKGETTDSECDIAPEYLYIALKRIKDDYSARIPILICECGGEFKDKINSDGTVHDVSRVKFIKEHLEQAQKFVSEGGKLKAFCAASLFDFNSMENCDPSFGITYLSSSDEKYVMKYSGQWYKEIISSRIL